MLQFKTREEWLDAGAARLHELFLAPDGHSLPKITRCSCGFPKGGRRAIGQCWYPNSSTDESVNIFVSPEIEEPVRVLDILLHELIHAVLGPDVKHGRAFRNLARRVGLAGKVTATVAEPGSELHGFLCEVVEELGHYPHGAIVGVPGKGQKKKEPTVVRLVSAQNEEFKLTISRKVLEEHGFPHDPWGEPMVAAG